MKKKQTNPQALPKGSFKTSMKKLLIYSKKQWALMLIAILLGAISVVFQILGPIKIKDITNIITNGVMAGEVDVEGVIKIALFLLTIYLIGLLLGYLQNYLSTVVTQKIAKRLRSDISKKINVLPLNYFDNHQYGDILSRVTNDVDTISQSMDESIAGLFSNILLFVGVLIAMFVTEWILALTVIATTILGFGFSMIFMTKAQKYFVQNQQNIGELNAHIEENYSGHNVVSLFNAQETNGKEFNSVNKKLLNSGRKSQFISGVMMPIMGFVGNFGYVAVCIVGAILASKRGVEYIGVISAFMIYVRLFSNPLSQIAQSLTRLQSTSAASLRVFEFLEEKEMVNESNKTDQKIKVKGDVSFEHVKFGYNEDQVIIKDFSADVKAGQKVAIVGPTGAGKTTLVNLLMRFYEINDGDIKVDGVSTKSMRRSDVHAMFGMVLQDTWLFQGTIKENLRYNNLSATDEQIVEACKQVGVNHFIQTLPEGYNTMVDDSINLSAGQKQLLTIARTMIENRPMMILDEATSSVDTRTEILLQQAMDKVMEGRTSLLLLTDCQQSKTQTRFLCLKTVILLKVEITKNCLKRADFMPNFTIVNLKKNKTKI